MYSARINGKIYNFDLIYQTWVCKNESFIRRLLGTERELIINVSSKLGFQTSSGNWVNNIPIGFKDRPWYKFWENKGK